MESFTLLIVDVQNDFLPGGSLGVPEGDAIVPLINQLIPHAAHVVATKDWHPTNHISFASNHPGMQPLDLLTVDETDQVLWPDHCIQESSGADFAATLDIDAIQHITYKGTDPTIDSYSGFFDNLRKKSTDLADYLHSLNCSKLVVVGLATDYCVKFTVLDALSLGFSTTVVRDACRAVNLAPDDEEKALQEMQQQGATVALAQDLLACSK